MKRDPQHFRLHACVVLVGGQDNEFADEGSELGLAEGHTQVGIESSESVHEYVIAALVGFVVIGRLFGESEPHVFQGRMAALPIGG